MKSFTQTLFAAAFCSLSVLSAPTSAANLRSSSLPTTPIVGYYSWNWGGGSSGPSGANYGVAFTGLVDVEQAIAGYNTPVLQGTHFLALGGGNAAGTFSSSVLHNIATNCADIATAGYHGVMFDVEVVTGTSEEVVPAFAAAFKACKEAELMVGITTSHSAPYQTSTPATAVDLVKAWVGDANVDILSPQLYSSGTETSPVLAETASCASAGCTWELYKGAKAAFAPSIVDADQLDAATSYFTNKGMTIDGFFQWKQIA